MSKFPWSLLKKSDGFGRSKALRRHHRASRPRHRETPFTVPVIPEQKSPEPEYLVKDILSHWIADDGTMRWEVVWWGEESTAEPKESFIVNGRPNDKWRRYNRANGVDSTS